MVGHGSSDNAASYGVYAFGLLPRWTAVRDSITLTVHYDTPIDLSGSMVIGLSQSGQTPDVVEYLVRARKAGAFTVAITNDADSDLAAAAEATIALGAGPGARRGGDEDLRQHARRARAARRPHRRQGSGDRGRDPRQRRRS